jgi:hypothetical protein
MLDKVGIVCFTNCSANTAILQFVTSKQQHSEINSARFGVVQQRTRTTFNKQSSNNKWTFEQLTMLDKVGVACFTNCSANTAILQFVTAIISYMAK